MAVAGKRGRTTWAERAALSLLLVASLTTSASALPMVGASIRPASVAAPNEIWFEDVSALAGVAGDYRTWGSAWGDYDDDDDPDLFINRHWAMPLLMRNDGGTYTEVDVPAFDTRGFDRHGCAWGEANADGLVDLYCAQGADRGEGTGPNQLLVQTATGFEDAAAGLGVTDPFGRGRTVNWFDHDGDGDLDLYVGNTVRPEYPNVFFARISRAYRDAGRGLRRTLSTVGAAWSDWDNDGDADVLVNQHRRAATVAFEKRRGVFRRVSLQGITGKGWMSSTFGDFNADGWQDLATVARQRVSVFRNGPGGFRRVYTRPLAQGRMAAWIDADNDSDQDLFVVQGSRGTHESAGEINHPDLLIARDRGFRALKDSSFRGPVTGNGDAVSVADHDRDGRLDLFVTNGLFHWDGPVQLLENRTTGGNWIGVDLEGSDENPWGYGARITVRVGRRVLKHQVTDGFSFKTQSETGYVHFGLGAARTATVVVTWPDGTRSCSEATAGGVTVVRQQAARCS